MKQWQIKAFSKLTKVTVRALQHYDQIGLLSPRRNDANDYRTYSEADLLRLQRILALKFFGFRLKDIQALMCEHGDLSEHLQMQKDGLTERVTLMQQAVTLLDELLVDLRANKSIEWQKVLDSIEVFQMTQELEHPWAAKVLDKTELEQFREFERELKENSDEVEKIDFTNRWYSLVEDIKNNISQNPESSVGIAFGGRCVDMVHELYGDKHANLKDALWHKGFKSGKMGEEHGLTLEMVQWLDKAMLSYWKDRVYSLLNFPLGKTEKELAKEWDALLYRMVADNKEKRAEVFSLLLADPKLSEQAKHWLKQQ